MKKLIMASVAACALLCGARAEHVNLWPLYYSDGGSTSIAWPLISYTDSTDWRIGTIYRELSEWGVFPFYMDFGNSVVVTPFVVAKDWSGGAILPLVYADFKGDDTFWSVFPAIYSHRWNGGKNRTFWAAAGLAGCKLHDGEVESHWLAPFWWRRPKERFGVLAAGLAGWIHGRDDDRTDWFLPFYWRDRDTFWSIPWACGYDADGKLTGWFSLPLLSWCKGDEVHITPIAGKTEHSNWLAPFYYWNDSGTFCTLLGGKTKDSSWLLPFYYKNKDSFWSIPYGSIPARTGTTRNWWGIPLFQTLTGSSNGFSLWPLIEYSRDKNLAAFERAMDADHLPDELKADQSAIFGKRAEESLEWLLGLAGSEHSIGISRSAWTGRIVKGERMKGDDKVVVLNERHAFGNELLLKRRHYKSVTFDPETGTREDVSESGSSHFLGFVWNSDWRSENGEVNSSESSVLWRVWRSKLEDGHSTLDVFPWFSHERDKNGKTTTSFLWRFFRYESNPEKGTAVDLLFIPVWR